MASCLTCDALRVVGSHEGKVLLVRCAQDPHCKEFKTSLEWSGLAPELRVACEDHIRTCAQCGDRLIGLAESRSSFCPSCKKIKRKINMGMLSAEVLLSM